MKKYTGLIAMGLIAMLAIIAGFNAQAAPDESRSISVPMYAVSEKGVGALIGKVIISQNPYGLVFTPEVGGLPAGMHGFHIHDHPSCKTAAGEHGPAAAMAAGGHWDPKHTQRHAGPFGNGHLGDLPVLYVNAAGKAYDPPVLAPRLKSLNEIRGHALMIHAGNDNYSDSPPLGGGGARIACGVIPGSSR